MEKLKLQKNNYGDIVIILLQPKEQITIYRTKF